MHNLTFIVHQFDQWEQILWMYLKVNVVKWETALLVLASYVCDDLMDKYVLFIWS